MIHSTAVIHPKAHIDSTVEVGPYAVIDRDVVIGPHCIIGPHVYLAGVTRIGARNRFHAGCVIGDVPQDLKYKGEPTRLQIGDNNVFRENVTVHCSNNSEEDTVIGSNNLLMANCHVAHNCVLGNHLVIANGALLGGHVTMQDRAFVSGNCCVHQFVRIGTLAMMQGGSCISKDLPPFAVARGDNGMCGLNTIGLRRAGFTSEQRLELRRLYHLLFRSGERLSAAVTKARAQFLSQPACQVIEFVASSRRGICRDTSRDGGEMSEADSKA